MSKVNNFLNTLSLLTTILILSLCYWARTNLPSYVSTFNYFSLTALAATIFILPDFICSYFPSDIKWYRTSEFYTGFLVLFLGIGGIILSPYAAWIGFIILPIGTILAFWQFYQFARYQKFLMLIMGLAFMVFMILIFYSQDCNSMLFPEKIILGKAHIDTLYHITLSNMFSTLGWPSSGLDGSPYIHYHWGVHALIAGLKNWTGLSTLMFFNIGYAAIFLPLFFKSLFNFSYRLLIYKGTSSFNILFAICFMLVLYSSLPFGVFEGANPISSESFGISLLFAFLYGSTLLSFKSEQNKNIKLFFGYSLFTIILISFFKISTGIVCFAAVTYLFLRIYWNFKSLSWILIAWIIFAVFVYLVIFQTAWGPDSMNLINRIVLFWRLTDHSFFTYLLGVFIVFIPLLKNNSFKNLYEVKSMIKSRDYIDLEILLIITLTGLMGGIFASSNSSDVFYFCSIQLFISIPFLIIIGQKYFDRFRASEKVKTFFLIFIMVICVISRPDVVKKRYQEIFNIKHDMLGLTQQQKIMKSFLADLFILGKEKTGKNKCIYIPQTEKWYYESQSFRSLGSPFVVPAVSGIAMIGGVPDTIFTLHMDSYGYDYYGTKRQFKAGNLAEARIIALAKGYSELTEYKVINENLSKQTFILK